VSDNPYDNIASWQWRWAKWARYAHMTEQEIFEETYKGGHSTESHNGMSCLCTLNYARLMRRLGKEPSNIVLPDNSNMRAKLVELGFTVGDDAIECVPDEDDDRVIEGYRGPVPDRQRVHPSAFEVSDGLMAILREGDDTMLG